LLSPDKKKVVCRREEGVLEKRKGLSEEVAGGSGEGGEKKEHLERRLFLPRAERQKKNKKEEGDSRCHVAAERGKQSSELHRLPRKKRGRPAEKDWEKKFVGKEKLRLPLGGERRRMGKSHSTSAAAP